MFTKKEAEMRIVASTASMPEEPTRENEEPILVLMSQRLPDDPEMKV